MRTSIKLIVAAVLAALALTACGGSSGGSSGSGTGSTPASDITISNFTFSPASLTVAPGAKVTVTNNDTVRHDVDSDDTTSFTTTPIGKGTFTFTAPMTPGSYSYHCSVHPNMRGTLIVA
jgi:plastocyanin